jgi:hypothetical protein
VEGASGYAIHWDLGGAVDLVQSPTEDVAAPPHVIENLPGGATLYLVVTSKSTAGEGSPSGQKTLVIADGGAEKFFPAWAEAPALNVMTYDYDEGLSAAQNGANLKNVLQGLGPGDELRIGAGTWVIDAFFDLALAGTALQPIRITAQTGAKPRLTRSDASQNTVNIGSGSKAEYLLLQGLEIEGGDIGLRIHEASNVWIDGCDIHHSANNALAANSAPVDNLHITRNEIHHTSGYGEGLYIGGNFGSAIARDCVIALNHVYETGGDQGDGIELKQGSYGNLIAENFVHDTNYPCILVYGTAGEAFNVIERNVCIGSADAVMQVQGEAIVRNNILANGLVGFFSNDHQDESRDLTVVHNTILNAGTAAKLSDWNGRPGMTFANNACYSQSGNAIEFSSGSSGVTVAGNVVFGAVTGSAGGFSLGAGLSDFSAADWSGFALDVTPAPGGALPGSGDADHAEVLDVSGDMRLPEVEAGAADGP